MADINLLLDIFQDINFKQLNILPDRKTFYNVETIDVNKNEYLDTTLYVGNLSEANEIGFTLNCLLLVEDIDIGVINDDLKSNNTVFLLPKGYDKIKATKLCRENLDNFNYNAECAFLLLKSLVVNDSVENLINNMADILKNPIILLNKNFKIIANSTNYLLNERTWIEAIERGYCTFEHSSCFIQSLETYSVTDEHDTFVIPAQTNSVRQYAKKLFYDSKLIGYLLLFESCTPFSHIKLKGFQLASGIVTIMQHVANELAKNLHEYSGENIVSECLNGDFKSFNVFRERISNTIFADFHYYYCIYIDVTNYINFNPKKEVIRDYILDLFKDSWTILFKGEVVSLVAINAPDLDIIERLSAKKKEFESHGLSLGISDMFVDLYNLPVYYEQCLVANRLCRSLSPQNCFALYNDYKFYDAFLNPQNLPIDKFYFNIFKDILEYDKKNSTTYVETIYNYIMHSKNLLATADALFIHKNTVVYRIKRAKELFNIDFDDTWVRFQFIFSYKLKEISLTNLQ